VTIKWTRELAAAMNSSEYHWFVGCHIAFAFVSIVGLCLIIASTGCTDNGRTRNVGGVTTIELPANEKLENATWNGTDLWYLTRPMRPGETAETHVFKERSAFGSFEGRVTFVESGSCKTAGEVVDKANNETNIDYVFTVTR